MPGSSKRLLALMLGLTALALGVPFIAYPDISVQQPQAKVDVVRLKLVLAQAAVHPAIFLGGGSNALTGLRAKTFSERLNRPVYNLSLPNEGGDFRIALALLERSTLPGDTVIYSSRGFHIEAPIVNDGVPVILKFLRGKFELTDRSLLRVLIPDEGPNTTNSWEQAGNFTQLGDFNLCVPSRFPLLPQLFEDKTPGRKQFFSSLAEFSSRMTVRGVKVLFAAPDMYVLPEDLPQWTSRYRNTQTELEKAGAQWLEMDASTVLLTDASLFCDTAFHPSERRAIIKSQIMAQKLTLEN